MSRSFVHWRFACEKRTCGLNHTSLDGARGSDLDSTTIVLMRGLCATDRVRGSGSTMQSTSPSGISRKLRSSIARGALYIKSLVYTPLMNERMHADCCERIQSGGDDAYNISGRGLGEAGEHEGLRPTAAEPSLQMCNRPSSVSQLETNDCSRSTPPADHLPAQNAARIVDYFGRGASF